MGLVEFNPAPLIDFSSFSSLFFIKLNLFFFFQKTNQSSLIQEERRQPITNSKKIEMNWMREDKRREGRRGYFKSKIELMNE